jgi:putative toxin-antitoxin system antitoxin component (TIGR02293 family)
MKTSAEDDLPVPPQVLARREVKVMARATEVLADESAARVWLNRPIRALGRKAPISLLGTEAGCQLVLDTLDHIAFGIVS